MKHTKNEFKEWLEKATAQDRAKEYNDTTLELLKARQISFQGGNPYHDGEYDIKMLKWKIKQIQQKEN